MNRKRIADGIPTIEVGDHRGYTVRVVAGYYIAEDVYLVHLYITPPSGPEIRVFDQPRRENHLDDALNLGFSAAESEIDQLVLD